MLLVGLSLYVPAYGQSDSAFRNAHQVLYAVRINGEDVGETQFLRLEDGRLLVQAADLERWRLRRPAAAPLLNRGEEYFSLNDVEGFRYRLIESQQLVEIE